MDTIGLSWIDPVGNNPVCYGKRLDFSDSFKYLRGAPVAGVACEMRNQWERKTVWVKVQ